MNPQLRLMGLSQRNRANSAFAKMTNGKLLIVMKDLFFYQKLKVNLWKTKKISHNENFRRMCHRNSARLRHRVCEWMHCYANLWRGGKIILINPKNDLNAQRSCFYIYAFCLFYFKIYIIYKMCFERQMRCPASLLIYYWKLQINKTKILLFKGSDLNKSSKELEFSKMSIEGWLYLVLQSKGSVTWFFRRWMDARGNRL